MDSHGQSAANGKGEHRETETSADASFTNVAPKNRRAYEEESVYFYAAKFLAGYITKLSAHCTSTRHFSDTSDHDAIPKQNRRAQSQAAAAAEHSGGAKWKRRLKGWFESNERKTFRSQGRIDPVAQVEAAQGHEYATHSDPGHGKQLPPQEA